ncbi:outer membrane beta-barrel protein [uncultured Sphingomonas sp.]|uniref:outer membrane beta-barrel protein n=1 Tax=uncultured Sphingomonas sp. TaxID=158754 RepID=UPI0025DFBB42|nr:outer membrane beta-barrel protein [uncultured Sphingomonas sp.]
MVALFATAAWTDPALAQRTAFTPRPSTSGRQIDVRASALIEYNDNVVVNDPRISGGGGADDVLAAPSLDLNVVLPRASGTTYLAGSIGYRFYGKYTNLNRENISLTGGADQRLASCLVHGEIGYQSRISDLSSLYVLDAPNSFNNTEESRRYSADIGCGGPYGLRPTLGYSRTEVRNSQATRKYADSDTDTFTAQLGLQSPSLGTISVFGRYSDSVYVHRPDAAGAGRDGIKNYAAGVQLERNVSSRFNFRGSVNYTKVDPKLPGTESFSGIGFDLSALYNADLFTVQLAGSRAAQPSVIYFVSYEIMTALSATVTHDITSRTKVSLFASKTWRDYASSTRFVGAPISGNDNMLSVGANASYDATQRLRFVLGAGYDERTSNLRLFKYHAKKVNLTASLAL